MYAKKILLFTALISVLSMSSGCNVKVSKIENESSEHSETTTDISETTSNINFDASEEYTVSVTEKGVEIIFNGETVQTIEGDFKTGIDKLINEIEPEYRKDYSPEDFIHKLDMDFDGYVDLFITTERKNKNTYGVYYHFNKDTGLFEKWDLFNKTGYLMYPSATTKSILLNLNYDKGYESYQYELKNNSLETIRHYKKYSDGKIFRVEHKSIEDEERNLKNIDMSYELNTDDKKLYIKNNILDFEDTVDMSFIEGKDSSIITDIFSKIFFKDYDSDGYEDLVIINPEIEYIYYHFNSESKSFEEWDEINEMDAAFGVDEDNQLFSYKNGSTIYYVWENGSLKPVKCIDRIFNSKEYVLSKIYEFDENGEKVFVEKDYKTQSLSDATPHTIEPEKDFRVNGKNIELLKDGELIQTLECNYEADKNKIEMYDFDFDGHEDIFISMEKGALYAKGTYFHYNVDTNLFEKWDELNSKIGREVTIDNENKRLYWVDRSKMEKYIYEWKYKKLRYKQHIILKEDENGIWFETYSIKNSKDVFEKREKDIYNEDNKIVGRFNPDDIYFKVNDSGLDVMILGGDEPLQHIDGDFKEYASKRDYAPEYYINQSVADYNSDGYNDLFIPMENENTTLKGIYYTFNPVTFQFDYSDELNNSGGYLFSILDDENALLYCIIGDDVKTHFYYKWEDSRLYCYKRIEMIFEDTAVTKNTYSIDIDGNETLTESKQMSQTPPADNFYTSVTNNHDFKVTENGIDIMVNGKTIQTIDGDFLEE